MKTFISFFFVLFSLSVSSQGLEIFNDDISHMTSKQIEELRNMREQHSLSRCGISFDTSSIYKRAYVSYSTIHLPFFWGNSTIGYAFLNKDSSVAIGIATVMRDSAELMRQERVIYKYKDGKEFVVKDWWLNDFKGDVDSTSFKPIFYSGIQLKKYNADEGVEFYKSCPYLFLDKYKIARSITLHKKYYNNIEIHYFIRQDAIVDIDREIKKGVKIISYN